MHAYACTCVVCACVLCFVVVVVVVCACLSICMYPGMYVHNYACLYMMYVCSYISGCMIGGGW